MTEQHDGLPLTEAHLDEPDADGWSGRDGMSICGIHKWGHLTGSDSCVACALSSAGYGPSANALMIAAAPTMLAALKTSEAAMRRNEWDGSTNKDRIGAFLAVTAAIAKAEGK